MLIRETTWSQIRAQFSEEEKKQLNQTWTGECICPRGIIINESQLRPELAEKIKATM